MLCLQMRARVGPWSGIPLHVVSYYSARPFFLCKTCLQMRAHHLLDNSTHRCRLSRINIGTMVDHTHFAATTPTFIIMMLNLKFDGVICFGVQSCAECAIITSIWSCQ